MLEVINLVAAFNGALVGLALLVQERFGPARTRVTLGLFLLLVSALLALFVVLDTGRVVYSTPIGVAMDVAALFVSALLLDYVATSVSQRGLGYWPYTLAPLYLIAALVNGQRLGEPTDYRLIVAIQIAYSLAALAIYLRTRRGLPASWSRRSEHLHLPVLLIGLALLHSAQVLRMLSPANNFLYNLVPLVGALGLLAFAAYAILGSQTLRSLTAQRATVSDAADFGRDLDRIMQETRSFLDPDLSLPKAAALAGATPQRLSAHLNSERGLNFRAYVNSLRIEEAKRLLTSSVEARSSIEAIAKLAGFRSRSTFYAAFQTQVGMSPQDYRSKKSA